MTGAPCPACGEQVMSFKTFFWKAEPWKTFACAACGTALHRPGAWLLLLPVGALGLALGVAAGFYGLGPAGSAGTPPAALLMWSAAGLVLSTVIALPLVKLIAYKFVQWKPVEPSVRVRA